MNSLCVRLHCSLFRQHLDEDTVGLLTKRVFDMAGVTHSSVKVYLNGEKLRIRSFKDYIDLYLSTEDTVTGESAAAGKSGPPRLYEKVNDRWEVAVSLSDGQFQQVSFVNSICTTKGGQHVNYIADQVTEEVVQQVNKKNKGLQIKSHHVRNHLSVFVNCLIENPAFDSQTKDTLTTRSKAFGSTCELSSKFIKQVAKCGIVDRVNAWARSVSLSPKPTARSSQANGQIQTNR